MDEEVVVGMFFGFLFGGWVGYLAAKARVTRQFLERWGDVLLMRARPAEERTVAGDEVRRMANAVDNMSQRFDLLEQRLDFTERLVERERVLQRRTPESPVR